MKSLLLVLRPHFEEQGFKGQIRLYILPSLGRYACLVAQSCPTLCDPLEALLFMGLPRQEYWNGLPFPSPGNLPGPGFEPTSPVSPALQEGSLSTESSVKMNTIPA